MVKHLLNVLGICCMASPVLATMVMDPDTGFVADTVITAGEQEVPCSKTEYTHGLQGSSTREIIYSDSLGRTIQWWYHSSSSKTNSRTTKQFTSELDSLGRISRTFGGTGGSAGGVGFWSSDTLTGKKWNQFGLIKAGTLTCSSGNSHSKDSTSVSFRVWIQYDSTKLHPTDTTYYAMEGFYPDTLLKAGEADVWCQRDSSSSDFDAPWLYGNSAIYRDSLGRMILRKSTHGSGKSNTRSGHSNLLELDSTGEKVLQQRYRSVSSWGSGQSYINKLFVGADWNEQGMITEGTIFGSSGNSQSKGIESYDTTHVAIVYDSTGILPIDTIFLGDPTAILSKKQMHENVISIFQQNNRLTINGVQKGTPIALYTPSGRILLNEVSQKSNTADLQLGTLPPGIYFLNVGGKTSFKVLHK